MNLQSCCLRCFPHEAKLRSIQNSNLISKEFTTHFLGDDYTKNVKYIQKIKLALDETDIALNFKLKLQQLLVSLLLPLGANEFHHRCGNSNGKMLLRLLLTLAIGEAEEYTIPETQVCRNSNIIFKIHTSTHLKNQPSQVAHNIHVTQDTLVCAATAFNEETDDITWLMTVAFNKLPCILIADTDTSSKAQVVTKEYNLMRDMVSYKRGFANVHTCGLLLTGDKVRTYVSLEGADVHHTEKKIEYQLSNFEQILDLIIFLNQFLHTSSHSLPKPSYLSSYIFAEKQKDNYSLLMNIIEEGKGKRKRKTSSVGMSKRKPLDNEQQPSEECQDDGDEDDATSSDD